MRNEDCAAFKRWPGMARDHGGKRLLSQSSSSPYRFGYARTALKYGLRSLGLSGGDIVLVPDFICASVIEPLDQLGIKARYYPVDESLRPCWDGLEALVAGKVKALLVAHYFGQPQDLAACANFCARHRLFLVEDNAHGYGGAVGGRPLGSIGHIGISSPRKCFPVRDGAYLHVAGERPVDLSGLTLQPSGAEGAVRRFVRLIKDLPPVDAALEERRRRAESRNRNGPGIRYWSQDAFRSPPLQADYGMDERSHTFIMSRNMAAVGSKRRMLYLLWRDWAVAQGLSPVFPVLSPEAVPLVFPAFTASARDSREWFLRGTRAGVDIHSWPTLPLEIVERNGLPMRIWEHLICLPIHQEMDETALRRRLSSL